MLKTGPVRRQQATKAKAICLKITGFLFNLTLYIRTKMIFAHDSAFHRLVKLSQKAAADSEHQMTMIT